MNVDYYRQRLLAIERELVRRLGSEAETARDVTEDERTAGDLAQVDELKAEYFALADTDTAILAEVRAALGRIEDGTYGRCAIDGGAIDPKRLESVPWTRYCLKHQQELEQRARLRTPTL